MHLLSWFSFKAIVHSKHRRKLLKMYLTSGHPKYRRVCFFNAILWIEISYFNHNQRLKLKPSYWRICYKHSFSLHKMLTDGLEWCGLLVGLLGCFYQLFGLSFWRHPFTAEHPLVSKWCNATFLQIWWRNKLILDGLGVCAFSANFIFGWTFALTPLSAVILGVKPKSLSCIFIIPCWTVTYLIRFVPSNMLSVRNAEWSQA